MVSTELNPPVGYRQTADHETSLEFVLGRPNSLSPDSVDAKSTDAIARIFTCLQENGIARLDGIETPQHFLRLMASIGPVFIHPDADLSGLTKLTPKGGKGLGFTEEAMYLHTDRSSEAEPPQFMALYSEVAATNGGESHLCDGQAVCDTLVQHFPKEFDALRSPNSAIFGSGDRPYRGSVIAETGDRVVLRFRYDQLGYYNRPAIEAMPILLKLLDQHTLRFKLSNGQAVVVDNWRWLHGRAPFSGHRVLWRVMLSGLHGEHT